MSEFPVKYRASNHIAVVTLDRPESRNALNSALVDGLLGAFDRADADPEVRVIVLTGTDPVFCAGADLKEMSTTLTEDQEARVELSTRLYQRARQSTKPVIGAINGHALAGGFGLAMSCDLLIASEDAEFGLPESQRGLVAALVMVSLSRLVSPRQAMDLLLTGRRISAAEAQRFGLVNTIVPKRDVHDAAMQLADSLTALEPTALALTKDLFYRVADSSEAGAMEQARLTNLLFRSFETAKAGAHSFTAGKEGSSE